MAQDWEQYSTEYPAGGSVAATEVSPRAPSIPPPKTLQEMDEYLAPSFPEPDAWMKKKGMTKIEITPGMIFRNSVLGGILLDQEERDRINLARSRHEAYNLERAAHIQHYAERLNVGLGLLPSSPEGPSAEGPIQSLTLPPPERPIAMPETERKAPLSGVSPEGIPKAPPSAPAAPMSPLPEPVPSDRVLGPPAPGVPSPATGEFGVGSPSVPLRASDLGVTPPQPAQILPTHPATLYKTPISPAMEDLIKKNPWMSTHDLAILQALLPAEFNKAPVIPPNQVAEALGITEEEARKLGPVTLPVLQEFGRTGRAERRLDAQAKWHEDSAQAKDELSQMLETGKFERLDQRLFDRNVTMGLPLQTATALSGLRQMSPEQRQQWVQDHPGDVKTIQRDLSVAANKSRYTSEQLRMSKEERQAYGEGVRLAALQSGVKPELMNPDGSPNIGALMGGGNSLDPRRFIAALRYTAETAPGNQGAALRRLADLWEGYQGQLAPAKPAPRAGAPAAPRAAAPATGGPPAAAPPSGLPSVSVVGEGGVIRAGGKQYRRAGNTWLPLTK